MLGRRVVTIVTGTAVLAAVLLGSATIASAESTTPTSAPTTTGPTGTPTGTPTTAEGPLPGKSADSPTEGQLTPEELATQIAAAEALRDELQGSGAQIAASASRLEQLSAQANALLEQYATARDTERTARAEAQRNVALLATLVEQAKSDRRSIGHWAYEAYSGGGSVGELGVVLRSLTADPENASDLLAQLDYLGSLRDATYDRAVDSVDSQRLVAARAVEATSTAAQATMDAAEARDQLTVITQQQQAQLTSLRALHTEQASRGSTLAGLLLGQGDDAAAAASKELLASMQVPVLGGAAVGKACSNDNREYPNGQLPPGALCPLYKAPGESLRPAAAAAFNALSKAYEKDTGSPICVTDSYRSYAEQVAVKAEKGKWAATPGTSEHGRGMALDLCGGINNFGSPAHLWMKQNAPLYGWFHPAWAASNGSLPEPWHWEFAG